MRRMQPLQQGLYDPWFEHDSCGFGFVVDIKGRRSHAIVENALTVLKNLEHRGAAGSERNSGDGAGLLVQMPHAFFARHGFAKKPGEYGAGCVFLPQQAVSREQCERIFAEKIEEEGQKLLGWRDVPVDPTGLGESARSSQPFIRQIFIESRCADPAAFERKLYVIRRLVEKAVSRSAVPQRAAFYVASLSHRTLVYKGMLNSSQLLTFYPDVRDPALESALAMVHARFSTNTFPSWSRAHPYRYISHNGE